MPLPITCAACGYSFRVKDEMAGKKGKCPKCANVFLAVAAAPNAPAAATPPQAKSAAPAARVAAPASVAAVEPEPQNEFAVVAAPRSASSAAKSSGAAKASAGAPAYTRKRSAARSPAVLWGSVVAAVLVLGGGVWALIVLNNRTANADSDKAVAEKSGGSPATDKTTKTPEKAPPKRPQKTFDSNKSSIVPEEEKHEVRTDIREGAPWNEVVGSVKYGIVWIGSRNGISWNGLGSGFVIAIEQDYCLVATNYHVVRGAVEGSVKFFDGQMFGIQGYRACAPESDLAILQINGVPRSSDGKPTIRTLSFQPSDKDLLAAEVAALGHPQGEEFSFLEGHVNRLVNSSKLKDERPKNEVEALKDVFAGKTDNLWIKHNAKIRHGNSGGPLINKRGEVLGINTLVMADVDFEKTFSGYAVSVRHLMDLQKGMSDQITKMEDLYSPMQGPIIDFESVIKEMLEEFKKKKWQFSEDEDFQKLQAIAGLVTRAQFSGNGPKEIVKVVSKAVNEAKWEKDGNVKSINDAALKALEKRGSGAFCFATVTGEAQVQGKPAIILTVLGSEKKIAVPVEEDLKDKPAANATVLVLGITGQEVGIDDKDAKAILVQSRSFLPVKI